MDYLLDNYLDSLEEPEDVLEIVFIDSTALSLIDHDCTFALHPVSFLIVDDDLPF
jgi:hypothetical protein